MHGESTHAALGAILVALSLASLAAQRRSQQECEAYAAVYERKRESPPAASAANALREGQRIDLNTASESDLVLLPGVGPKLAKRILEERARRGAYSRVDELLEVRGMGPKTLARVEPWLRVTAGRADTIARRPP